MTSIRVQTMLAAAVLWSTSSASAQFVLGYSDSTNAGALFNAADGSLVDPTFIEDAALRTYVTSRKTIEVGDELWAADISRDRIWRFDRNTRALKGEILGGNESTVGQLPGMRGLTQVGSTVYGTLSDSNDTYQQGIVAIDVNTRQVNWSVPLPVTVGSFVLDVVQHQGELLVSRTFDETSHVIDRYDLDGSYLGVFAESNGSGNFNFPAQLAVADDGSVFVTSPMGDATGIYKFSADGTPLGIVEAAGQLAYGVAVLPDGRLMWNQGEFPGELYLDDSLVQSLNIKRMLSPLTVPSPGALVLFGAAFALPRARRRC